MSRRPPQTPFDDPALGHTAAPNVDIRVLAFGLAAGILLDATVIRSLLVPALVALWNWWIPNRLERALSIAPAPALESPTS